MNFQKLFYPGMWIMRKMRFATKLGVMVAVAFIPMVLVAVKLVSHENQNLKIASVELVGIRLVSQTSDLIRQLQTHRGQTNMVLSGNAAAQGDRDKTRLTLRASRDVLDANLLVAKEEIKFKEWIDLKARVDGLVADHDSRLLRLPREQQGVDHILLVVGQRRPRGRTAGGRERFHEKLVGRPPHEHRPLQAALTKPAPLPGDHDRVGIADPGAHLEDRRQDEKCEHRHDRESGEGRLLVLAKDTEGTGHGTACRLWPDGETAEA